MTENGSNDKKKRERGKCVNDGGSCHYLYWPVSSHEKIKKGREWNAWMMAKLVPTFIGLCALTRNPAVLVYVIFFNIITLHVYNKEVKKKKSPWNHRHHLPILKVLRVCISESTFLFIDQVCRLLLSACPEDRLHYQPDTWPFNSYFTSC